jgi:hypothetical protein
MDAGVPTHARKRANGDGSDSNHSSINENLKLLLECGEILKVWNPQSSRTSSRVATMASPKPKKSSFDAFSKVDELVSKPVVGSDGAASWQSFRKENHATIRASTAPKAPLKKADKLGTGFSTWDEERAHEGKIRRAAGHAETNSGYSVFNNDKKNAEEAASRKRKAQIEARIRPDDKEYFIPSETFQGWKFDYVFTTRNGHNTGYYWDGMDSIKKENGELKIPQTNETNTDSTLSGTKSMDDKASASKSKKKRKRKKGPTFVHDPNNPMEQMQAILQKRNQALMAASDNNLPSGWEAAKDPSTGKSYYFHRASRERSWEKPKVSSETTEDHEKLPEGWKSAVDQTSGKTYYHHTNGTTTWTKPE